MRFMNWLRSEQSEFTFLVESQLPPHGGRLIGLRIFPKPDLVTMRCSRSSQNICRAVAFRTKLSKSAIYPVRRTISSKRSKNVGNASSGSRASETMGETPRLSITSS